MRNERSSVTTFPFVILLAASLVLLVGTQKRAVAEEMEIGIDLAQDIVNLQSSIAVITFHTTIKWRSVDCNSITLTVENDPPATIPVYACTSDSRGYLKAGFLMDEVEDMGASLLVGEVNSFILDGETREGLAFWGVQELLVMDVKLRGR